ncbi:MAG: tetratricopeptide repeat protein [Candidatus Heimdallarchaeota archaeon]
MSGKTADDNERLMVIETYNEIVRNSADNDPYKGLTSFEERIDLFISMLPVVSNKAYLYGLIGKVCFHEGKPEEARDYFKQAVEKEPNFNLHKVDLGLAYYQLKDYHNAIQAIKDIDIQDFINQGITNDLATLAAKQKDLFDEIIAYLSSDEITDISILHGTAIFCEQEHRYKDALECYKRILEQEPSNRLSVSKVLTLSEAIGEPLRARLIYLTLLKKYPGSFLITRVLLGLYYDTKEYQLALSLLEKTVKHYPDNPDVLFDLAFVSAHLKQEESTLEYMRQCLYLAPDYFKGFLLDSVFNPYLSQASEYLY